MKCKREISFLSELLPVLHRDRIVQRLKLHINRAGLSDVVQQCAVDLKTQLEGYSFRDVPVNPDEILACKEILSHLQDLERNLKTKRYYRSIYEDFEINCHQFAS